MVKRYIIIFMLILTLTGCNFNFKAMDNLNEDANETDKNVQTIPDENIADNEVNSDQNIPDDEINSDENTPESETIPNDNNTPPVDDNIQNEPTISTPQKPQEITYYGSDNDVYRINITTSNNVFPTSLSKYITGDLNITEQNTDKVLKQNMSMQIRLRGNSTSGPNKKPFKIKFDKSQSLFGLAAAKDWVLLANYFDKTDIRNYLAYMTANKFDTLGFQPSSIFVDVYVNGEYQGLYMLTEQIEANHGRVDIEKNINSDGICSFLIEADARAVDEYRGYKGLCYTSIGDYKMRYRYPNANNYLDAIAENNTTFIKEYEKNISWGNNFLNKAFKVLKSNDFNQISQYFDIDSFIDYYLIQEFFKNVDAGTTSQFYIIDQSKETPKIACGPVWDFDIAAGVVDNSMSNIYNTYANTELFVRENDDFYYWLFKNETFLNKVKERYKETRKILYEVFSEINIIKNTLSKAQTRNLNRWPLPTIRTTWIEQFAMSKTYFELISLNQHYKHLKIFLNERIDVLDKYYG